MDRHAIVDLIFFGFIKVYVKNPEKPGTFP
jgi:hypothetical protein